MSRGRYPVLLWALPAVFVTLLASLHAFSPDALAEPQLAESVPADGGTVEQLPEFIHVCFSEPIDYRAEQDGFRFSVIDPSGASLGLRTAWLPLDQVATCADIYPGRPQAGVKGEWTLGWEVVSAASGETGSGAIKFTVTEDATATPTASPRPTPAPGQTAASTAGPGRTLPPSGGTTGGDGSDPDVLLLSLLTIGAAGAAGFVGLIGFAVRQRVGFWMHKPPERTAEEAADHN